MLAVPQLLPAQRPRRHRLAAMGPCIHAAAMVSACLSSVDVYIATGISHLALAMSLVGLSTADVSIATGRRHFALALVVSIVYLLRANVSLAIGSGVCSCKRSPVRIVISSIGQNIIRPLLGLLRYCRALR